MIVGEIKDINIIDGSRHFKMVSDNGGSVHFAILGEELCACDWSCPGEGRIFLKELEKYADENNLKLYISNVINPKLETILKKAGYIDFYIRDEFVDDTIQCWKKEK